MKTLAVIMLLGLVVYGIYWFGNSIPCQKCIGRFIPENNKAPWLGAMAAGATAGATAGAISGAYAGSGTGVALGPGGAVAGTGVGATIGGVGGAVVGGISGAWHRDKQVQCPWCDFIFYNPKN